MSTKRYRYKRARFIKLNNFDIKRAIDKIDLSHSRNLVEFPRDTPYIFQGQISIYQRVASFERVNLAFRACRDPLRG